MYLFREAWINITENSKQMISFVIFVSLSFSGISVTDSLIFSVSDKAEKELKIYGDNVISVTFYQSVNMHQVRRILSSKNSQLSFSKKNSFKVGITPYTGEYFMLTGVDKSGLSIYSTSIDNIRNLTDNQVIISDAFMDMSNRNIFINGIPFVISGRINKNKTDFLDSLGLSTRLHQETVLMSLDTMFRLTLNNNINAVSIILDHSIRDNDIKEVKNSLINGGVDNFDIFTASDARDTVEKVLSRFRLLINAIYIILTLSAMIASIVLCKRNLYTRQTEFAIKIIHGIDKKDIFIVIFIESVIVIMLSLLFTLLVSLLSLSVLTYIIHVDIKIRLVMVSLSIFFIVIVCFIANLVFCDRFFKINPVYFFNGYMQ